LLNNENIIVHIYSMSKSKTQSKSNSTQLKRSSMVDLGIFIATKEKVNPYNLGIKIWEELKLPSIYLEDLLTSVAVAKRYGVSKNLEERVIRNLSKKVIKKVEEIRKEMKESKSE
jgi:hypothetical protein